MSRIPISGIPQTYADTQAGDTFAMDRGGVMGKITYDDLSAAFIETIGVGTISFSTAAMGFGRVTTSSASRFDLQATSVADTHERTRLVRDTTAFRHQTGDNSATTFVDDYVATVGASGVTEHQWNIEGTEAFTVSGNSGDVEAQISGGSASIRLIETDGTSGYRQTLIGHFSDAFQIQTRNSSGTLVATDYVMAKGASGATAHSWRIAGVEQLNIDASNITIAGTLVPGTTLSIGQTANRFSTIFLTSSPNVSSDARLKEDIRDVTAAELRAARRMRTVAYRMKSDGSQHYGYIAQEIVAAMEEEGLDAIKAGLVTMGEDGMYGINEDAINAFRIEALARG